jgi:hypothetical protein
MRGAPDFVNKRPRRASLGGDRAQGRRRLRAVADRRAEKRAQGPFQSKGMCLLEFVVHWNL